MCDAMREYGSSGEDISVNAVIIPRYCHLALKTPPKKQYVLGIGLMVKFKFTVKDPPKKQYVSRIAIVPPKIRKYIVDTLSSNIHLLTKREYGLWNFCRKKR